MRPPVVRSLKVTPRREVRRARWEWGLARERAAESEWRSRVEPGARILARNFRARGGELDWVAELPASGLLVLVEVRARAGGLALESVGARKRARIRRAAEVFLWSYRGRARGIRIDLVVEEKGRWDCCLGAWEY